MEYILWFLKLLLELFEGACRWSWLVSGLCVGALLCAYVSKRADEEKAEREEAKCRYKLEVDGIVYDNVQYTFVNGVNIVHIVFYDGRLPLTTKFDYVQILEVYSNEKDKS